MMQTLHRLDLVLPVLSNQCGICHAHEQSAQQDQSNDQHSNYSCVGKKGE